MEILDQRSSKRTSLVEVLGADGYRPLFSARNQLEVDNSNNSGGSSSSSSSSNLSDPINEKSVEKADLEQNGTSVRPCQSLSCSLFDKQAQEPKTRSAMKNNRDPPKNASKVKEDEQRQQQEERHEHGDQDEARPPAQPAPIPPRQHTSSLSDPDEGDLSLTRAFLSPSAPSPPLDPEKPLPSDTPLCCQDRERKRLALQSERDALRGALHTANEQLSNKDEELANRVGEIHRNYNNSLAEMKNLLHSQRKVGKQWKGEMETLTERFQVKLKELQIENKELKVEMEKVRRTLEYKEIALEEAQELNGIYSAKLTKMERKFKKLKDEDEESYMEMTF